MRISEILEDKEIKTKKIPYGFTLDLMVDGDHVGQYTHTRDDDIVRNFAEIFPEYRNKGYGTMLLLAAIKTADDMGMDFEEDTQSLTPAMSRLYDELSDSGLIYGGGGAWTVSPGGENELEDWLLEVTAPQRVILAEWWEQRYRWRHELPEREGNDLLKMVGKLPRSVIAEILKQISPRRV